MEDGRPIVYRKESLSSADYRALCKSLKNELDIPDFDIPSIGFLPSTSDIDKESRAREERAEAFKSLVDYAVCGLLESRLRPHEAGLVFDAEERQLLVVSHNSSSGYFAFQRIPIEPSGVDVEWLKRTIHEKAEEGYLFVSNTLTSITFEPAFGSLPVKEERADSSAPQGELGLKRLFSPPSSVDVKLDVLPESSEPGFWKVVTKRVQAEAKRGWILRGALKKVNVPRLNADDVDAERSVHSHLVYSKVPGFTFPVPPQDLWREAVEFSPVRALGPEVDGTLMNKGVFETIRIWAAQGWVLQAFFYCELPLTDNMSDDFIHSMSEHEIAIEERVAARMGSLRSSRSARSSSRSSTSSFMKRSKCAMRYHSLLYFARAAPVMEEESK